MANTLTAILPKILARSLMVLREQAVMPRLVNGDYSKEAAQKGSTIDVPIPTAVAAIDVTPAQVPPAPGNTVTDFVQISLDKWKQNTPIHLTDKELNEIDKNEHFLPMQLGEAIRGIANEVNGSLHDEYLGVYGYVGVAGTTPFASDVTGATLARKVLNQQLCPRATRRGVLDFDAEANALALSPFADAEKTLSNQVKMEGELGRKYGIDWVTDDGVVTHTAGTAAVDTDVIAVDDASNIAAGLKTFLVDVDSGTSTFVIGDIFTIAGDEQTYVATNADTIDTTGVLITFEPGLSQLTLNNAVITFKATHKVNLVFHRDAFAYATRPLVANTQDLALGSRIVSMSDPVTGINLRLEVSRQHKQVVWEFDHLWGAKLVRPELACRLAG